MDSDKMPKIETEFGLKVYSLVDEYVEKVHIYDLAMELITVVIDMCTNAGVSKETMRDMLQGAVNVYAVFDGDFVNLENWIKEKLNDN